MKRLPALMLSVFLLTLLSLPATAENVTVDRGSVKKEVTLTVDASNMVDVTINWDDFNYTFDGKNFTATSETMPKITVKNNNSQNTIYVTPKFEPYADLGYSDMAFDMYFYEDGNTAAGAGTDLKELRLPERMRRHSLRFREEILLPISWVARLLWKSVTSKSRFL